MASKSKLPIVHAQREQRRPDGAEPREPSGRSATRHLVSRIAQALQISEAVLYRGPDAVDLQFETGGPQDGLTRECAALLQAYRRIHDPVTRHRLLALVQEAAP